MENGIEYTPIEETRGRWKLTGTRTIYENRFGLKMVEDRVITPKGKDGLRTRITSKAGVYAVPVFKNGDVGLIDEFYYNLDRTCLACVTGGIDVGKTPLESAKEELKQERGLVAKRWDLLGYLNPTGLVKIDTTSFLARDLNEETQQLEGVETIKTVRMPLETAIGKIGTEIIDACSAASLFMAQSYISKEKMGQNH